MRYQEQFHDAEYDIFLRINISDSLTDSLMDIAQPYQKLSSESSIVLNRENFKILSEKETHQSNSKT